MDEAARLADAGTEEGTLVIAEAQTSGRGRFGRNWVSPKGNLYLSVVLRPSLSVLPRLTMVTGVAVVRAIRKITGLGPRIKWPNDVLVEGKKVAGILVEAVSEGETVRHAVIGIGINIKLSPAEITSLGGLADALENTTGQPVARDQLLRQLLVELDSLYHEATRGKAPLDEWRALLDTLGQRIQVTWHDESWVGQAEQVDENGNLVLRLDDGNSITMTVGDVTLHGATA